jgi:hypothetical protein
MDVYFENTPVFISFNLVVVKQDFLYMYSAGFITTENGGTEKDLRIIFVISYLCAP